MTFKHGFGIGVCALAIWFGLGNDTGSGAELRLTYDLPVVASYASSSNFVDLESKIHQEANDRDMIKAMPPVEPVKLDRDTMSREYRAVNNREQTRQKGIELCKNLASEEECRKIDYIIEHESGWVVGIENSEGCKGLSQACPGSKLGDHAGTLEGELTWTIEFARAYDRIGYEGINGAYRHKIDMGWW